VWSTPDTAGGGGPTGNEGDVPCGVGALVEHAVSVAATVIKESHALKQTVISTR
jgi:hypothetical protein